MKRLEAAVARLEALSAGGFAAGGDGDAAAVDPSIVAFDDLISQYVNRVTSAGEKIGGQVLDVSKIIAEAFTVQKELLVKIKQTQVICLFFYVLQVLLMRDNTEIKRGRNWKQLNFLFNSLYYIVM